MFGIELGLNMETLGIILALIGLFLIVATKLLGFIASKFGKWMIILGAIGAVVLYFLGNVQNALTAGGVALAGLVIEFVGKGSLTVIRAVGFLMVCAGVYIAFIM